MDKDKNVAVKVFTTQECGFCRVVKAYLHSLNVKFKEVDLNEDREAVEWVIKNVGQVGVPLTLFNESEFVLGWQKEQIDIYLKKFKLIK